MTLDAAQGSEEPEPGPASWGEVRRRWDTLAGRFEHLMADIEAGRLGEDAARQMAAMTVALREARNAQSAQAFTDVFTAGPPRPAPDTAPMARVYRLRPRPAPAHALAPAAGLAVLGRHGAATALHLKIGVAAFAAASITAAGVTYTIARTPDQSPAVLAPAGISPAAADPPASAILATPPAASLARHHRHARPAVTPPLAGFPVAPSPAPSPSAAPGQLNVQNPTVVLQQGMDGTWTGTLTLTATGGPVRWRVDVLHTSSVLRFGQPFGVLQDGESAVVTVTVDAAQVTPGAQWTISLDPGGQPVTVTAAG